MAAEIQAIENDLHSTLVFCTHDGSDDEKGIEYCIRLSY